mgnify:CR=1 FL=1
MRRRREEGQVQETRLTPLLHHCCKRKARKVKAQDLILMSRLVGRFAYIASVIGILLFILSGVGFGNELGAGDAAHFLRSGIGAGALGMGGAFVAVADDVSGGYWNPAGVVQTSSARLGGTSESRYGGLVSFQYLAGVFSSSTMGLGLIWAHSDLYSVYLASAAGRIGGLSLGANGKLYAFGVSGEHAQGIGLDAGVLYRLSVGEVELAFGLTSSDIGWSKIHWQATDYSATDYVAWVNRVGAALEGSLSFGWWQCTADLEVALRRPPRQGETDYLSTALQTSLRFGAELRLEWFAVRAGLADIGWEEGGGLSLRPTLGIGVQLEGVTFDAAWIPSQLGGTYLLSIEFQR